MAKTNLIKRIKKSFTEEFYTSIDGIEVTGKKHSNGKFHEFTYIYEGYKFRSWFTYIDVQKCKIFIVWKQEYVK